MNLYRHQAQICQDDRLWSGIFLGTGGGKTITTLMMAEGKTLVICPKQTREDKTWENNAKKIEDDIDSRYDLTVISKEDFKKMMPSLRKYDTVIVDECHNMLGVLPDMVQKKGQLVPKTSQLFSDFYKYIQFFPPKRLYLLSATPASKPMHVFALGLLLKKWKMEVFYRFREKYYFQRKKGYRTIWLPKNTKELQSRLAEVVNDMGYTGKLSDWFDVPEQTHREIYFSLTAEQKKAIKDIQTSVSDPMVVKAKQRTIENGCLYDSEIEMITNRQERIKKVIKTFDSEKVDYILERAIEFPKMLIFANYIGQINAIRDALVKEGYNVITLTGETKDRGSVISEAEKLDNCIVIAQSGISEGYELKTVPVVIFASKSYRHLHFKQAEGRVLRADALKKNLYLHLIVKGGTDEACHKCIMSGEDFYEKINK